MSLNLSLVSLEARLGFVLGLEPAIAQRIVARQATLTDLLTAQTQSHLALEVIFQIFLQPEKVLDQRLNPNFLTEAQLRRLPGLGDSARQVMQESRPFFSLAEVEIAAQLPQVVLQELLELPTYQWPDKPRGTRPTVRPVPGVYTAIAASDEFEAVPEAAQAGFATTSVQQDHQRILVLAAGDFEAPAVDPHRLKQSLAGRICPALRDAQGMIRYLVPLSVDLWFRPETPRDRVEAILAALQLRLVEPVTETLGTMGYYRAVIPGCPVDTDPLRAVLEVVELAGQYDEIRFAEPEQIGLDDFGPDTTHLAGRERDFEAVGRYWNHDAIALGAAHQLTQGSDKVTIFVIDGGVDTEHPAIAPVLRSDWQRVDLNFTLGDPESALSPQEISVSHGTQVTSVAIAPGPENGEIARGVAPLCRVLPIKISGSMGYGLRAAAIRQAIALLRPGERGILNLSWRTNGEHIGIREALQEADRRGFAIVTSAGNYGAGERQIADDLHYPSAHGYRYPYLRSLCVVAASTVENRRASYSYFGSESITLAAPGGEAGSAGSAIYVASPRGQHAYVWGTSFAAPHVAGLLGLMFARNPQLSAPEAIACLQRTAQALPASEPAPLGRGIVNAYAAVMAVPLPQGASEEPQGAQPGRSPEPPQAGDSSGKVNLNTATAAELARLSLMNNWRIEHLLRYRETQGPLQSIWDLLYTGAFDLWTIRHLQDQVSL